MKERFLRNGALRRDFDQKQSLHYDARAQSANVQTTTFSSYIAQIAVYHLKYNLLMYGLHFDISVDFCCEYTESVRLYPFKVGKGIVSIYFRNWKKCS